MVFDSIKLYSAWEPNHTTNTIFNRYSISTINLNLFPFILNTTRFPDNIDALRYFNFKAWGDSH